MEDTKESTIPSLKDLSDEDFIHVLMDAFCKFQKGYKINIIDRWEKLCEAGLEYGNPLFESLAFKASKSMNIEFKKRYGVIKDIDFTF